MAHAALRLTGWLLLFLVGIFLFFVVAPPLLIVYLALVAIATPIILATLPWARIVVWKLVGEYLVRRRIAWVSLVAVSLCVAMVIIVLSVMSGWLQMFRSSFKTMTGDLIVSRQSTSNFAYYDEMIAGIEKVPQVEAAIPVIRTAGLLAIPTGSGEWTDYVGVVGLPPLDETQRVLSFKESLWLQHDIANYNESKKPVRDPASFALYPEVPYKSMTPKDKLAASRPGMIVGAAAIGVRIDRDTHKPTWPDELNWRNARLTVVPRSEELGSTSTINATTTPYWLVDGSRTQAPQHDKNVYVPFAQLQKDLNLTAYTFEDAETHATLSEPAKTTEIQIKLRPGVDMYSLKPVIQKIVTDVVRSHAPKPATRPGEGPAATMEPDVDSIAAFEIGGLRVQTWEEQQSGFLNAVENEITIMMTLFGCISLVAVFMIFCIFYTIVVEKTRDIGILKSVGASAWDVAQIFLAYGAAIGFVGGAMGVLLGWTIVTWINEINRFIGWLTGRDIYSSDVYAIDHLPNHVDPKIAVLFWAIGIVAAIGGACLPALLAARRNAVEALRFE